MEKHDHDKTDLTSGLIGLAVAVVGLAAVIAVSHFMAL